MLCLNTHMDPYQQYPGAPAPGGNSNNPYEFILNPSQSPKKRFGFGGGNFAMTLALIVGGAFIFMIIVALALNSMSPKTVSTADLISVTQTEEELIRVSEKGAAGATQQTTKNLAATIQFTMLTQQNRTLNFLAKNGTEVGPKDLKLKQNAITDQQLASAKTTSTFDITFSEIMQKELENYANTIKQLHSKATSKTERDLMGEYYEQAQLLISQIPYTKERIQTAGQ